MKAEVENPWFTKENIKFSLNSIGESLRLEKVEQWMKPYRKGILSKPAEKKVAVVMAGNIPAVGFHDFLCVLVSGHQLIAKLSSQDQRLLPAMAKILIGLEPEWKHRIDFSMGKLPEFQMIIATGADNTFRYFEYYFRDYPHLIRHNRNSVAILQGNEAVSDLEGLSRDMLMYFGLGCRNVTKLYVPDGYDFSALMNALESYRQQCFHSKYFNNYEYYKSVFLLSKVPFHDTGFFIFTPSQSLHAHIGSVNFEEYKEVNTVFGTIRDEQESIQCIVYKGESRLKTISPGETQTPELGDYADGVDTMTFLQQ